MPDSTELDLAEIARKGLAGIGFSMEHFPDSLLLKVSLRVLNRSRDTGIASVIVLSVKTHLVNRPVRPSTRSYRN